MSLSTLKTGVIMMTVAVALADPTQSGVQACYLYGIDFNNYDVNKLFSGAAVESPQKCQEFCQADPLCSYWTYIKEPGQCYLKSSTATLGSRFNPTAISGPKLCTPKKTCFDHGMDYRGYDLDKIEGGKVTSAEACQSVCSWRKDCHFWTYIPRKRDCYLKDKSALNGRLPNAEAVSGPKTCA